MRKPKQLAVLTRRSNPTEVKALQRQLVAAGADIAVDGDLGPRTKEAIREYQQAHGLTVDGRAGRETRAALAEVGVNGATAAPQMPAGAPQMFPGQVEAGNIDLHHRSVAKNADGSISTVLSKSFQDDDGKEVLVPTVSPVGTIMPDRAAWGLYKRTGKHLGKFDSPDAADRFAQSLHEEQDQEYSQPAPDERSGDTGRMSLADMYAPQAAGTPTEGYAPDVNGRIDSAAGNLPSNNGMSWLQSIAAAKARNVREASSTILEPANAYVSALPADPSALASMFQAPAATPSAESAAINTGDNLGAGHLPAGKDLASALAASAAHLGINPVDLGTAISYETGGTFDPWKRGPTTKWGTHRGLIQWGEPQAAKYGVHEGQPVAEQLRAVENYLTDAGVRPGAGLLDIYSAINAGHVGRYDARDAAAGGAPGTVRDKVEQQMAGHRAKAEALLAGFDSPASSGPSRGMAAAASAQGPTRDLASMFAGGPTAAAATAAPGTPAPSVAGAGIPTAAAAPPATGNLAALFVQRQAAEQQRRRDEEDATRKQRAALFSDPGLAGLFA